MNPIHDQHTSISPPFDLPLRVADRGLEGCVIPRPHLAASDRSRMYVLLDTYFQGTSRAQFESDLAEKDAVLLLRDRWGQVQGFSTYLRIERPILGEDTVAFFSGDTIVARPYWGETVLSRLWARTIFTEAARIRARRPRARCYWFLICSGYKTYRFLPVFFRDFYPHPEHPSSTGLRLRLDALASGRFGSQYDAAKGVVRLTSATPLRPGVAAITEQRLRDPAIEFYVQRNPGHAMGDELACLTEIDVANLTPAGARMLGLSKRRAHST